MFGGFGIAIHSRMYATIPIEVDGGDNRLNIALVAVLNSIYIR